MSYHNPDHCVCYIFRALVDESTATGQRQEGRHATEAEEKARDAESILARAVPAVCPTVA